jgi:hypothetical protein
MRKNTALATNPTATLIFTIPRAAITIFRCNRPTLSIFYPSGSTLNSKYKLTIPHIIDRPPILLIKTIRAIEPIGASPSGVEDSSIY